MTSFSPAYSIVQKHEGGYVNNANDAGGETYRGIARKVWPSWEGWPLLDTWKIHLGLTEKRKPKTGEFVDPSFSKAGAIDAAVRRFYENLWKAAKAESINSQEVANAYFDFYVLHSKAVKAIQEAAISLGSKITADNIIGSQTLAAINSLDPTKLLTAFYNARKSYHDAAVAGGYGAEFYDNWVGRAASFLPDLESVTDLSTTKGKIVAGSLGLATCGTIIYLVNKSKKRK